MTVVTKKASYWQEHLDCQRRSYLSKRAYCREHSLAYSQFLYWFRKENKKSSGFIRIKRKGRETATTSGLCTIELSQGHRLVIRDELLLPRLKHIVESLS